MENDINTRVSVLEQWRISLDIARAKEETDRTYLDKRLTSIEKGLEKLNDTLRWFTYTAGASAIGYLVVYAFNGGFSQH
jgi:hypothetical protein